MAAQTDGGGDARVLPISLLVVALALAGQLFHEQPRSYRPAEVAPFSTAPAGKQRYYARLWQDPLRAVGTRPAGGEGEASSGPGGGEAEGEASGDTGGAAAGDPSLADLGHATSQAELRHLLPVLVPGTSTAEDTEARRRMRRAVIQGLATCGYVPERYDHLGLVRLKASEGPGEPSLWVPFERFVPARDQRGPPAGDDDGAALLRARSVDVLWVSERLLGDEPLDALLGLMGSWEDTGTEQSRSMTVVGPSTSDALKRLTAGLRSALASAAAAGETDEGATAGAGTDSARHQAQRRRLARLRIYNPRATIQPERLAFELGVPPEQVGRGAIPQLVRTTCSDGDLARTLVNELLERGVALQGPDEDGGAGDVDQVLILGEWDTGYSRALQQTLIGLLDWLWTEQDPSSIDSAVLAEAEHFDRSLTADRLAHVHLLTYAAGLDGALPEEDRSRQDPQPSSQGDQLDLMEAAARRMAIPVGTSQLDMIQRSLEALRRELRGPLAAVVLTASDVYDKQLVLQALRGVFPEALCLTTDLDARLLHPRHYRWTRNLLIASGHDLAAADGLWRGTGVFREAYQTATYLATRMALGDGRAAVHAGQGDGSWRQPPAGTHDTLAAPGDTAGRTCADCPDCAPDTPCSCCTTCRPWDTWDEPLIFEVGRSGAVLLSALDGGQQRDQQEHAVAAAGGGRDPVASGLAWLLLSLVAALLIRVGYGPRKPHEAGLGAVAWRPSTRVLVLGLGLGLLVSLLALALLQNLSSEPSALLEGVSIWPTEYLHVAITWFCLAAAWTLPGRMRERSDGIERRLRAAAAPSWRAGPIPAVAAWRHYRSWLDVGPRRVLVLGVLWGLAAVCMCLLVDIPRNNYRDTLAMCTSFTVRIVCYLAYFLMTYVALEETLRCARFIKPHQDEPALDDEQVCYWLHASDRWLSLPSALRPKVSKVLLVAEWTNGLIGRLVLYPFGAFLMVLLSRTTLIDNWLWPLPIVTMFAVVLVVILRPAIQLRRRAEQLRAELLDELSVARRQLVGQGRKDRQLSEVQDQLRALDVGAYSRWSSNPVIQAVAMPFGGMGLISLVELMVLA